MGPGFLLAGRYQIVKVLGRGGMGMVYQAHDRLLEETVAIKVLRPDVAGSPEIGLRFRAEIKIARAVSHKNVGRIHEYGEDRGLRYISMAYVDGVDLKRVLRQRGPLPPGEALEIGVTAAEALQAIHDEGIIHRDLKTPNIMLDSRGVIRLMDFGIAKQSNGDGLSVTVTGQTVGTPEYMSPEQVQGLPLDGRSDVYSLGIVVFELLTGVTPFRAETPLGTALKHLHEPPPLEGPQAAKLPAAVVPVLRKALAKAKEERYASAREMALALAKARASFAATVGPGRTERRWALPDDETSALTLDQGTTAAAPPSPPATQPGDATTVLTRSGRAPGPRRVLLSAAAAGAVMLLAGVWLLLRPAPAPSRSSASPPELATQPSGVPAPATSPEAAPSLTGVSPAPSDRTGAAGGQAGTQRPRPAGSGLSAQSVSPTPIVPTPVPAAPAPVVGPGVQTADAARASVDARVDRLLSEADAALETQSFDQAIGRYDEALRLDPRNAVARGPAARPAPTRSFAAGKTVAESAETRADGALASAFEASGEIAVTRDTQAAVLPGRIEFRTEPEVVRPGDRYKLEIRFVNAGGAPIEIKEMVVTNSVNGKNAGGPVAPSVSTVAPGQGATLLSLSDTLKDELKSWSLDVKVRTGRGESYKNRLVWSGPEAR